MADLLGTSKLKKMFRGAYNYYRQGQIYSEETFEVFKDTKELTIVFQSQILSRVRTGELLKIDVNYTVNKDWVPIKVQITKSLGQDLVEEDYKLDVRGNLLIYSLKSRHGKDKQTMTTPPRFHISTPTTASSMLFFLSKKFDGTTMNYYTVVSSQNRWKGEFPLEAKTIAFEKISLSAETLMINGAEVSTFNYRLTNGALLEDSDHKINTKKPPKGAPVVLPPSVIVSLSRHLAIPYRIAVDEKTKVEIKYLNNLQEDA